MASLPLLRFVFLFLPSVTQAQSRFTISGFVSDSSSGEALIGASVYDARTLNGTTSNVYGFYSLTLPADTILLTVSYVGYTKFERTLRPFANISLNIPLSPSIHLKAVEVIATGTERIEERSQMSTITLPIEEVKALPMLLGERDILKAVQLLPGVQSGAEGTSGLYVRGGGPEQNLILLDGVPVYNASHLFGFFSVFNPDAVNSVQLIKGGFPARYGGRLSSVLDIRMKEGNVNEFRGQATIGLVASKLTLEGPVQKGKSSFIISGRRTYIDLLAQPIIKAVSQQFEGVKFSTGYYFYDLNAKFNHRFSTRSRLFVSSYLGNDKAYTRIEENYVSNQTEVTNKWSAALAWGNITTAVRWNYELSSKAFMNVTGTHSRYRFNVGQEYESVYKSASQTTKEGFSYEYISGIYDWGVAIDLDYLPNPNHFVKVGIGETYHTFTPGVNTVKVTDIGTNLDTSFGASRIYAHQLFAYAEDDIRLGYRFKVNAGVRLSGFLVKNQTYAFVEPRISGRYLITDTWSAKASFSTMAQYIHLLTNASIGLPTDLWVPVTDTIRPMHSSQVALGLARTINNTYEVSVEGYYKTMNNLIEYKEGASFFSVGNDWQTKVESGKGWAYGAEVFIQKKTGMTKGWIGYTLSWSMRQFENLNFGESFPYKYDRRHDISVVITHKFSERTDVGMVWVYGTGNAITLPITRYEGSLQPPYFEYIPTIEYFAKRNDFRMRSYHRLDVSINRHKQKKRGMRTWSYGFYNAYSRRNPFYVYVGHDHSGNRQLKQVSLFPIIPFFSWTFEF